uniref:Uncharacterized protein n=1 Tax=Marseillevirus LCMAC201 TaxID=2506605 RepID=A0A481YVN1_9VIRU|nr:MAG: hypothetical protein LCMAC201_00610 [Marseillevirus LCMAC201]
MWFLKGRPTAIDIQALMVSISGGYQQTSYRFKVDAEPETTKNGKVWIAIAIPWAPHKENGSFKLVDVNLLSLIIQNSSDDGTEVTMLTKDDLQIYERLRSLKTSPDIELVHVQELCQWYLDDIGVATCWIEPGKTYQIDYSHKIAADSCLFLPTRLPTIIMAHKPKVEGKLWVVNGMRTDLPSQLSSNQYDSKLRELLKESQETLDCYTFNEWGWDLDTRIHTENWESSDDDWTSEEEEIET